VLLTRDVLDLDFYPSRISDPTTETKEEGEIIVGLPFKIILF
jgi:hypothetical protein